jgi:multidrug resistance protein, MATE family
VNEGASRSEWAQLIQLAVPMALQQLGFQLMGTVDAAWLGHYEEAALAAAGVGNNVLFGITAIALGVVMGLDTVIPQAIGAGCRDDARRFLSSGIRLAILVGMASTILVLASPLVLWLAAIPDEVADYARIYMYIRALGIVPFLVSVALRSYLAALHVTRPLIVAVIVGNLVNAGLDAVLIFGVAPLGLPPLGVVGAAIATVSSQVMIVAVYFAAIRALDGDSPAPRGQPGDLREIVRYGGPVGGQLLAEIGIFGVATLIASYLGTRPGAAHAIALNLVSFTFSVALGIGGATSVRVGHAVGAGDLSLARRRGLIGLAVGLFAMSWFAIGLIAVPGGVAKLFTDEAPVIAATVPLLQIAALFQLSDGTQAIGAGALRGLGHTRATLWGNLVGHYAIGLGISLALTFGLGLGAPGLWWGLSAGLTSTALFLVWRFVVGTRPTAQRRSRSVQ